ncbi:RETICULATA-RELATED 1 protein [Nymphaea thermarum]|nr:RETICULATA-RELATED 1 protein [Nymphaea thermarum]
MSLSSLSTASLVTPISSHKSCRWHAQEFVPAPVVLVPCSWRNGGSLPSRKIRAVVETDPRESLERCWKIPSDGLDGAASSSSSAMAVPVMKQREYGAFGTVTLEKGKLDLAQKTSKVSPQLADGGGSGNIGKQNNHGGGDGGDDGGDDDDYFGDFEDGDEGDEGGWFRRRLVLQELFDRKFVEAVLQEWSKTMMHLPAGLRQAYEMGLVSSAQMVKYLSITARPTTARFISRSLPQAVSRAFIGRMLADPSFLWKMVLEQVSTIGCTAWWEIQNRKGRLKKEWDLALINILTVSACNAVVVWSLAPCRSYGNTFQFDLQNTLQKLPNNIFEKSYPLREFDLQKRIHSFFYRAAQLCTVGVVGGAIQGCLSKACASKKEERISVTLPAISTNALGYGAFLGLYANMRYQLLYGAERAMLDHFDVLGVVMFFSTAFRLLNIKLGEVSRLAWLGVEVDPLLQSDSLLKAYERPVDAVDSKPNSKWFISKSALVSGVGLLGIKQGNEEPAQTTSGSKTRRKRVVRKKVAASSS